MIDKIEKIEDIKLFAKEIIDNGVSFHPDDDFNDYVYFNTGEPIYTKEEADVKNKLMEECFIFCEKEGLEIYEIMLEVIMVETGLDQTMPLPISFK